MEHLGVPNDRPTMKPHRGAGTRRIAVSRAPAVNNTPSKRASSSRNPNEPTQAAQKPLSFRSAPDLTRTNDHVTSPIYT